MKDLMIGLMVIIMLVIVMALLLCCMSADSSAQTIRNIYYYTYGNSDGMDLNSWHPYLPDTIAGVFRKNRHVLVHISWLKPDSIRSTKWTEIRYQVADNNPDNWELSCSFIVPMGSYNINIIESSITLLPGWRVWDYNNNYRIDLSDMGRWSYYHQLPADSTAWEIFKNVWAYPTIFQWTLPESRAELKARMRAAGNAAAAAADRKVK